MKKFLLLCFSFVFVLSAWAQERVITGRVSSSEDGSALPGVNVVVKGTTTGSVTDADGKYSLSVPSSGGSLVFSFIGLKTTEIEIGDRTIIDIQLGLDVTQLAEIVVTGFGSQIKQDLTGNVASVKGSDIASIQMPTLDAALQGRAAGVFVTNSSGKLGQAVTVRVRGTGSISAGSEPLYVVDGVPITTSVNNAYGGATNPLVDINPSDIESMEVLKDASAAAIYGSRAANGVILITTKRGKSGKTSVSINYSTGTSKETRRVDFLNSEQYAELIFRAAKYNDDLNGLPTNDPSSDSQYARDLMSYHSFGQWDTDPKKTYNWQDQAFQEGKVNQLDLQLSGGNEKTKFFASMQHLEQEGIMYGTKLTRTTGRVNLDQKANDWFNFGVTMSMARTLNVRLPNDGAFSNPLQSVALLPMTPFNDPTTKLPTGTPPGDINVGLYYNPRISLDYGRYEQESFRNLSNIYGTAKLLSGLTFQTEFGVDILAQNEEGYFQTQTIRNQTRATNGVGSNASAFVVNLNAQNYLTYTKDIGKSSLNVVGGMQYQQSSARYSDVEGLDFPSDSYKKINSAATKSDGSSEETAFSFNSLFLRANYKFNNKYLATFSVRRDGSSRFGSNARYGVFPAGSVGWVISEENFLKSVSPISFLKLRASYGQVGNAEIGDFPQRTLFSGDAGYAGAAGQRPSQLGNPDLRWETTDQVDIGLDFGFFNNRLTGEIDYYEKNTTGLLLNVNIPRTTGFRSQNRNVGSLQNRGFELVLNSQNLVGKLKWSTSFNIGYNENKVINTQGQIIDAQFFNRVQEGQPVGVFYTVEYAGVDPANGDALFYKNTRNPDGSLDRSTVNRLGYNQAQRTAVGKPNPDYIAGLTNNLSYKGFDLSVFFNGVFGNQISTYGMGRFSSANMRFEDNQTVDQLAAWTTPGQITNIPQARFFQNNGAQLSSRYVVDGSFIRLRNVTLGYSLPTSLLTRVKLERVRLYVSGLNLLTITNYPFWDPEVNADLQGQPLAGNVNPTNNVAQANDFYTPPQPRTIMFGVNIGF
ncbi:MAG: TonB-dependent receptor [Flammeovirgaceae bacterium]|jgi:TonB-linked SusC/RagA family outer membrane protein|nr:TonB-dependent receptor [Flammeovirgaceae bacterium]